MTWIDPDRNAGVSNIQILRPGKSEVSTAVDLVYRDVLIRKGPDAIDSTIALSVDETLELIGSLQGQIKVIDRHESTKTLRRGTI